VMSLATIHRELYQTKGVGDVHAAELLDAIARQTVNVAAGPDRRFDLQLHLNDIRMTPDQAVPLALLVGEGLMNAVACARTTAPDVWPLNLRLTQTAPDAATLQIEGFAGEGAESVPEAMEESYSLSGQLMTVFALQLGGKLEQTVAQGKYNMRVDFQLRPLVEGEDRHAVHAPEPV
jgi:two-component sensor histidine kinase